MKPAKTAAFILIMIAAGLLVTLLLWIHKTSHKSGPSSSAVSETAPAPTPSGLTIPPPTTSRTAVPPFRPLQDAATGEYARYAALDDLEVGYLIEKAGPGDLVVQFTVRDQGKPLGQAARRLELRGLDPLQRQAETANPQRSMRETTIEAAGRRWPALLYEDRWVDEEIRYLRRTWVSPEAPVYGIVQMELYGDDTLEARITLIEFGTKTPSGN